MKNTLPRELRDLARGQWELLVRLFGEEEAPKAARRMREIEEKKQATRREVEGETDRGVEIIR
jgi:hypothetical protein